MEGNLSYLSTIALTFFSGVLLVILSKRLKMPAIVFLLAGGIFLGPQFLGLIKTDSLGSGLQTIISICVAIILFDGGLTLNLQGYKRAPKIIIRLLTIGVLITWFATAFIINKLFGYSISFSLLCASLIIVTGPTVISPILRNVKVREKLHHILHWESVLIDPIGVFIAILCFEWYTETNILVSSVGIFALRVIIGISVGIIGGFFIYWLVQRKWVPDEQTNIFVFSSAILLYGISDYFVPDSGILTVVIAGFVLGWKKPDKLKQIKEFKSEISELAIGILFILLAAHLNFEEFLRLGKNVYLLIGAVILLIRPLNIAICSIKTSMTLKEWAFLSWISPRGVVAASMASLFAIKLSQYGSENAFFIEVFTYSIIIITVVVQGSTSGLLVKLLKLKAKRKQGWLIVGAHQLSRDIATIFENYANQKCFFVDTNYDAVNETRVKGFKVFQGNALNIETIPEEIILEVDNVLAITDNSNLNAKICEKLSERIKKCNLYYWSNETLFKEKKKGNLFYQIGKKLTKPSEISYDIKQKKVVIDHINISKKQIKSVNKKYSLFLIHNDQIILHSDDHNLLDDALEVFIEFKK